MRKFRATSKHGGKSTHENQELRMKFAARVRDFFREMHISTQDGLRTNPCVRSKKTVRTCFVKHHPGIVVRLL